MKRTIYFSQLIGFCIVSFGGTLLHFLYDWLNQTVWIAPFSGVNESTWEHMKLLFWPMLIFATVQSFFLSTQPAFWCIKLRGTLIGICTIPILFYLYNGVISKSPSWLNIAIFFISAALAYAYETHFLIKNRPCNFSWFSFALLCVLAMLFAIFTFEPPKFEIFKDPLNGTYGILK